MKPDDILNLNTKVFQNLVSNEDGYGSIIFTQKYQGKPKIREPEARYVYCKVLEEKGYNFGLEVPTEKSYSFKGSGSRKALTDLSILNDTKINIEFKEGQPIQSQVDKDIEKLIREKFSGVWFHIFQTRNPKAYHPKGTINTMIRKINKALSKHKSKDEFWIQFVIAIKYPKELWYTTRKKRVLNKLTLDDFKCRNP